MPARPADSGHRDEAAAGTEWGALAGRSFSRRVAQIITVLAEVCGCWLQNFIETVADQTSGWSPCHRSLSRPEVIRGKLKCDPKGRLFTGLFTHNT
jgi:hypothetical protein